jgi:hypothetical protein
MVAAYRSARHYFENTSSALEIAVQTGGKNFSLLVDRSPALLRKGLQCRVPISIATTRNSLTYNYLARNAHVANSDGECSNNQESDS